MLSNENEMRFNKSLKSPDELEGGYETLISKFDKLDITHENAPQLMQCIFNKFGVLGVTKSEAIKSELWFFRVRVDTEFDDKDASQFGAPPQGIGGLGRCNLKGTPVFYCSEQFNVALDETNIQVGQRCYLSLWCTERIYPTLAMIRPDSSVNSERLISHAEERDEDIEGLKKHLMTSPAIHMEKILEIERRIFRGDAKNYPISALYCNYIFNKLDLDGVSYPDKRTGNSYNFAFKSEFASSMKLYRVFYIVRGSCNKIATLRFGSPIDPKNIEWRGSKGSTDPLHLHLDPSLRHMFDIPSI